MSEQSSDPLLGQVLGGRYEILRRIDRGGMATVYKASDQRLTRTVAIKVMHEHLTGDANFVARFDREARAAARLSHPNVVSVFDQGTDHGNPYIVMEYIPGQTLRKLISREAPMPPARAIDLILPVVSAVAAAHEVGIIHRDIKPENVLISVTNQVKVADFGLARAVGAQSFAASSQVVMGTLSYLPKELLEKDQQGDERSDVYSLGVVLYEMLTGKKPHTGEIPAQVMYSILHNRIESPSKIRPKDTDPIPDYLDALIASATAPQITERPADASVLLDHLQQVREALAAGKATDPQLANRMLAVGKDATAALTEEVPLVSLVDSGSNNRSNSYPSHSQPGIPRDTPVAPLEAISAAHPLQVKQRHRRRRGLAIVLVLLLIAASLGFGAWYFFDGRFTQVPNFAGVSKTRAETLGVEYDLSLEFDNEYSEDVPKDRVTQTNPKVGERVERGGLVRVYLSQGPERYPMPKVVGTDQLVAENTLTESHLSVGRISSEYSESVESGKIVKASVKAGTMLPPQSKVDLVISQGPAPITVASYVDRSFKDAEKFYKDAGLKVTSTEANDSEIIAGNVISQTPLTGELFKGDTIDFVVSKGPEMVKVPQAVWCNVASAEKLLKDAGFKVKTTYMPGNWMNLVGRQVPVAKTMAPKGSTVEIYIG